MGETTQTVTANVLGDTEIEPDETFELRLFEPTGGATLADGSGAGTILNDDGAPPPPPPPPSGPCILVEPKAPVDFGTGGFSRSGAAATKTGTPDITVMSCADAAEQVSVRGTDATGGATTWTLSDQADDPCSLGINVFGLALGDLRLGPAARPWAMLAPAGSAVATARLTMPCSGSGGSGETLTARLAFTATAG